jgi:glycosyltransferase involved in cell wall biosynthesis
MATYGGIERHVCVLAEEAAKRNHHVRFLTTSNSLNEAARSRLLAYGIDFRELPRARGEAGARTKLFWLAREVFKAKFKPWDIIYTNGQSGLAKFVWNAGRRNTRIIHHHHTAADAEEQKTWAKSYRLVLEEAQEVVGCSVATCEHIAAAVKRNDVRYLPYFTACPVEKEDVRDNHYTPGQPLAFGFIGRLIATKGVGTLCELSQRPELSAVTWHIYGSGPDFPETYFQSYPRVQYHGPYRDLARYGEILRELDAVALYSQHNEGMPLSLIESMSAGLPWIATDRGGTRELAVAADNCVVVNEHADFDTTLRETLSLVDRLYENKTSRVAQRAVYDAGFAPARVSELWFNYLEKNETSPG